MALDKIAICNEALAEVPADFITSFDEGSLEAEWSARLYPSALGWLLEKHDWKFPTSRVALALVDNDRSGEWAYAYAIPENVAGELRVFPSYQASAVGVPLLTGQRLAPTVAYYYPPSLAAYSYLLSGSVLYTNVQDAVLEFIAEDPTETRFPAMFTRALALELASRLVMPLKKDRARQGDLIKWAQAARDEAIADMRNRDPSESRYDMFENETQLAREGLYPSSGFGWWETR